MVKRHDEGLSLVVSDRKHRGFATYKHTGTKRAEGRRVSFVKLRIRMEILGLKSCKALASTCGLRRSLDGCLKFRRSGQSRRVRS